MKHLLFTVYDEKAEVFTAPFFVPTVGLATRAFTDCINSDEHHFGKHPHDYTLFSLGSFEDADASIDFERKKSIGNGVEFLNPKHVSAVEEFNRASNTSIQPNKTG